MQWFFDILLLVCVISIAGMFFISLEGAGGIFKTAKTAALIVLGAFFINSVFNIKITMPDIKSDYISETDYYSDGVKTAFSENLENSIKTEIEKLYPGSEPCVYVVLDLNKDYKFDIFYVSVALKKGNIAKVKKIISQNCGIDESLISVEKV